MICFRLLRLFSLIKFFYSVVLVVLCGFSSNICWVVGFVFPGIFDVFLNLVRLDMTATVLSNAAMRRRGKKERFLIKQIESLCGKLCYALYLMSEPLH